MLFVTCLMKQPSSPAHLPQTKLLSGPVIDYSFKNVSALKGLEAVQPCSGRPRQLACTWSQAKVPNVAVTHPDATQAPGPVHQASMGQNAGRLQAGQQGSEVVQAVPAPTAVIAAAPESCRPALNSTAVRLSYNPLPSLAGLLAAMTNILDDPAELQWLDLSHCKLLHVDTVLTSFPKLQILYMHANTIKHLHEIQKLGTLKHLRKMTLHGNPVAEHPHYKWYVCQHLPGLQQLDFVDLTVLDKDVSAHFPRGFKQWAGAVEQ